MVRSVRLSANQTPNAYGAIRARTSIPEPAPQMYGIYGAQNAAALAAQAINNDPAQSQAERAFANAALRNNSQHEADAYREMLMRAQDMQMNASRGENAATLAEKILSQDTEMADRGGVGMRTVKYDESGNPYVDYDAPQMAVVNANGLNNDQATRFGTYATAIKTAREAGVDIAPDYISEILTPPTQAEKVPLTTTTEPLTPGDKTTRYGTDEGLTAAQQMEIAQLKASAAANGDDIKVSVVEGEGGVRDVTYTGTPEALIRNGIDPATGKKTGISPKADGNGGVPSATPAAPNKPVKTTLKVAAQPADGFFAAKYMSSDVGPRKRPIAGASTNHKGQDFAHPAGSDVPAEQNGQVLFAGPMKGFGRAAKIRYEDGSVVLYGHINPSVQIGDPIKKGQKFASVLGKGQGGISTGPHVHRQIMSEGNPERAYATRLKQHPLVADVKVVDDNTLVTMKDGTSRVYHKGRRIG